jgi:hypothetical protein
VCHGDAPYHAGTRDECSFPAESLLATIMRFDEPDAIGRYAAKNRALARRCEPYDLPAPAL